ncbi:hypothetical protein [Pedobacter frigoris]|uniref:Uncharacterized protein n=1 Tax=Pedobacter frigoris TaxID=2571272 RepID=A0A4U1CR78_9SPHI|nr:hypothetical protein [Pedobacter frigoris]TKC09420.1 hypothetical protein FA047_04830 [Pedobacter frigoris]
MAYTKERKKLEKLSEKTAALQNYDDKSLAVITDIYEQYSHTARILKNKDAELFNNLYLNELNQVKECKRSLKAAEDRQANFIKYKETLLDALNKTVQAAKDVI